MPLVHCRPLLLQPSGHIGECQIRTTHGVPQIEQDFSDATHTNAANTHEVEALCIAHSKSPSPLPSSRGRGSNNSRTAQQVQAYRDDSVSSLGPAESTAACGLLLQ